MDLAGGPAADLRAAMQEDLEQTDDARLVDLEAGITHRADGDRMGEALQQREIDMHVEPLGLECQSASKIDPLSASKIDPPCEGLGR